VAEIGPRLAHVGVRRAANGIRQAVTFYHGDVKRIKRDLRICQQEHDRDNEAGSEGLTKGRKQRIKCLAKIFEAKIVPLWLHPLRKQIEELPTKKWAKRSGNLHLARGA